MSLRNISNFFNIIKKGRLKSQLADTDMIPIGTRDITNRSAIPEANFSDRGAILLIDLQLHRLKST